MSGADALRMSAIRRSGYIYPEKLKRLPLPSGYEISGCKMSAHGIPPRVDWAMLRKGDRLRVQGVGTPLPDDTECARLYPNQLHPDFPRGHAPPCYPEQLHPNNSISYPDMLSGWKTLAIVSKPCYNPLSTALQWCVRTPCPDIFAMDS